MPKKIYSENLLNTAVDFISKEQYHRHGLVDLTIQNLGFSEKKEKKKEKNHSKPWR